MGCFIALRWQGLPFLLLCSCCALNAVGRSTRSPDLPLPLSSVSLPGTAICAPVPRVLPHVVFGNSSTSAPPQMPGSNVRSYYCASKGLKILEAHYLRSNLYIYP